MWVICSHSKLFVRSTPVEDLKDANEVPVSAEKTQRFFAPKNPDAQEIPEWCRETGTFKLGVNDGTIRDLSAKALDEAKASGADKKPKEPRDDSNPEKSKVPGFGLRKQKQGAVITVGE